MYSVQAFQIIPEIVQRNKTGEREVPERKKEKLDVKE